MIENPSEEFDTPEAYAEFLRFGSEDGRRESPLPGDFIHDLDGIIWFVSGGSQCVGSAFCQWHCGMDAVYSVGSCTIANVGVPVGVLRHAANLLRRAKPGDEWAAAERDWLVELGEAALAAKPSDDVQSVYE